MKVDNDRLWNSDDPELKSKIARLRADLETSYDFRSRLFDQVSSLRATVDMPELYLDEDWRILGYSIQFPGLSRKVVECKNNSAHLSEFLKQGEFNKIQDYLARVNDLKELPYDDGEPWRLVYEGPTSHEKIGTHWIPYKHQFGSSWSMKNKSGRVVICHAPHVDDAADCYLISGREYGNEFTDVKIEYKTRTPSNPSLIKDLSLVISGGAGNEVILPDLFGYTACTGRANTKAGIQRKNATMLMETEILKPDTVYTITVERTGGRISRMIADESGASLSPPWFLSTPRRYTTGRTTWGFILSAGKRSFLISGFMKGNLVLPSISSIFRSM